MTHETREEILNAIEIIQKKIIKRMEGNGWKVYLVGKIVRVDLEDNND